MQEFGHVYGLGAPGAGAGVGVGAGPGSAAARYTRSIDTTKVATTTERHFPIVKGGGTTQYDRAVAGGARDRQRAMRGAGRQGGNGAERRLSRGFCALVQ